MEGEGGDWIGRERGEESEARFPEPGFLDLDSGKVKLVNEHPVQREKPAELRGGRRSSPVCVQQNKFAYDNRGKTS